MSMAHKNQMNSLMYDISNYADMVRLDINKKIYKNKCEFEQYFSSISLSKLMASMFKYPSQEIEILDPGAGIGSLFVACVEEIVSQELKPKKISITAYEIDKSLYVYLEDSIKQCEKLCENNQIKFSADLIRKDFIVDVISKLTNPGRKFYSHIIINPPYKKINSFSKEYKILKNADIDSTNLYTAFIALSEKILQKEGQMVFISPRSFCNGSYFQSFRKKFLDSMRLKRIHIFNSRKSSFSDDDVLQENIIIHAVKTRKSFKNTTVSSSSDPDVGDMVIKKVQNNSVVDSRDPQSFIHIVSDEVSIQISDRIKQLKSTLNDLGIDVSTGKVVDFRIRESLRHTSKNNAVPLIHPFNLSNGSIKFPVLAKKKNYIRVNNKSKKILVENGNYVLVKRFSTKEEKKRIMASVWTQADFDYPFIGFENRVNYFHKEGKDLKLSIAKGLSLFLNSSVVDLYFRQFNGNTQVNATDLRYLKYPTSKQLEILGSNFAINLEQEEIDDLVEKVVFNMSEKKKNPVMTIQKISQATDILKILGFPKQQQNDRSALTLLSLLNLKPADSWDKSIEHLIGVTPMMKFFDKYYGKKYAPNSRETVRRQTIHQFIQAGLIEGNPDKPTRPTNSGKTVYQITRHALELIQNYNTSNWKSKLSEYEKIKPSLQKKYEKDRKMKKIPLELPSGKILELSPGGQNILIEKICHEFAPRFAPNGIPLLIGDTAKKSGYYDGLGLKKLGISFDSHGKIPDVIIHDVKKNWLLVIEAVTSHGPVNPKRQIELKKILSKSKIGIVFVTAFLSKKSMLKYFNDISWETDVWIAETSSHMIHFNGDRFLGPYG